MPLPPRQVLHFKTFESTFMDTQVDCSVVAAVSDWKDSLLFPDSTRFRIRWPVETFLAQLVIDCVTWSKAHTFQTCDLYDKG